MKGFFEKLQVLFDDDMLETEDEEVEVKQDEPKTRVVVLIPYLCMANFFTFFSMLGHQITCSTLAFSVMFLGGMMQLPITMIDSFKRKKLALSEFIIAILMMVLGGALFSARRMGYLIIG